MKIGNVEIDNNIFLAPMAGITDKVFRTLCKEQGCGLVYSEMVSAKGLLYENENTEELLAISDIEHPAAVQLFGSDPAILANAAEKLSDSDFDIIDLNMGCPAPKIVKNGEGSALMLDPKLIGQIVQAVSDVSHKPVTVKIRKGFHDEQSNAAEVARIAEANGAAAVAVHGRTRGQYYSGRADWNVIRQVKEAVSIPIIGNGDITDEESAERMFKETNCDAIMIGRAAQGNPWIFGELNYFFSAGRKKNKPATSEIIELALRHAKMLIALKGEYIGIREMRKHLAWYIKGRRGAAESRVLINHAETVEEFRRILGGLL